MIQLAGTLTGILIYAIGNEYFGQKYPDGGNSQECWGKCKIYRLRGAIIGTYENDQMYDRLV